MISKSREEKNDFDQAYSHCLVVENKFWIRNLKFNSKQIWGIKRSGRATEILNESNSINIYMLGWW